MDTENISQYLSIFHSPCISTPVFSRLLMEFGTISRVRALSEKKLLKMGFETPQIAALKLQAQNNRVKQLIDQDLNWAACPENSIISYESSFYPPLLKQIQCSPPLLYVVGQKSQIAAPQFAIVGSRKSSNYGRRNAYWMANELSQAGLTICSGMAKGIDAQAHQGALDGEYPTIAVMGTGADKTYPACNGRLAEQIKQHGAVVSEFPLGTVPHAYNFPRRNRIISGMSLGTLVVEATWKSGSLITARFALEQNRDVFAFPGPITNQSSRGCHRLIKDGAKLVEEPSDILEEIGDEELLAAYIKVQANNNPRLPPVKQHRADLPEQQILSLLGEQGCVMQLLLEDTKLGLQQLNMLLLQLEMQGRIITEGGRYYRVN